MAKKKHDMRMKDLVRMYLFHNRTVMGEYMEVFRNKDHFLQANEDARSEYMYFWVFIHVVLSDMHVYSFDTPLSIKELSYYVSMYHPEVLEKYPGFELFMANLYNDAISGLLDLFNQLILSPASTGLSLEGVIEKLRAWLIGS